MSKNEGEVLKGLSRDELMLNLVFKTLCLSFEQIPEDGYNEFAYEDLSKSDMNYLFELLVVSEKYTKEYLEGFAGDKETICILSKSRNAAKIYLSNDNMFNDFVNFDKKTLNAIITIFYNYGLIDEMTDFFVRLVEKINNGEQCCDEDFFFSQLKGLCSKNKIVNNYMLKLKTLLIMG